MNEAARQARNAERLAECHPAFARKLRRVLGALEEAGLRPRIQDAWRSPEAQLEAYRTGHSKLRYGYHNATGKDGRKEALACDVIDDDHPLASRTSYLLALTAAAWKEGLDTGLLWGLPPAMEQAAVNAIQAGRWDAPVRVGWDPTHVEWEGLSVARVKAGDRPEET